MAPLDQDFFNSYQQFCFFCHMSILYTVALITGKRQRCPPPPPAKKRKHIMWIRPLIQQRDEKGAYSNLMADLYNLDNLAFKNYTRMTPDLFDLLTSRVGPHLRKRGPTSGKHSVQG